MYNFAWCFVQGNRIKTEFFFVIECVAFMLITKQTNESE